MQKTFCANFYESFRCGQKLPVEVVSLGIGRAARNSYRWSSNLHKKKIDLNSHYTIQFTLSGCGAFHLTSQDKHWDLPENAFFMCGMDMDYYYEVGDNDSWEYMWLALSGDIAGNILGKIIEQKGIVVSPAGQSHSQRMLYDYITQIRLAKTCNPYRLSSFAYDFLLHLQEELAVSDTDEQSLFTYRAHRYVMDNIEHINVDSLAEHFNYHPKYFSSICKKMSGKTPHKFIEERRLSYAANLLTHTDRSLREISMQCNFSSEQHLCSCFRKAYGTSPGQYRKNRRHNTYDNVMT